MAKQKGDGAAKEHAGHPTIVAIGASAGGVGALQRFFANIPERTGAAYVVVVHLDPDRPSELAPILKARTQMPVVQVQEEAKLEADHVYVIPPGRMLQITDHRLSATPFSEPRGQRSPVDHLFRSLAERLGDGFAVILSGAGSDGALGVRAVKEAGGIILVQDPAESEYPSMPRSAIASGIADVVLPVADLAARLGDLIRMKHSNDGAISKIDEDLLRRVLAHLRVRTGHDFSKYKRSTVLRRIARRMQVTRSDDLQTYYDHMRENAEEAQALLSDLLISVTTFFRDADTFETLRKDVLPKLFEHEPADPIRVWVSGCATGEEAYTLAMLLMEEGGKHDLRPPIQVFGSDLDARALTVAREGRYPATIENDVGEERLRRFFIREGDGYRVRQDLRDMVLFALHDLLKDPPFSRVDLISCRNVLIYLDRELQEQVCSTFHYALNPGGFLLLGSSETAENPPGLFRTIDRAARLYQSTAHPGDKPRSLPRLLGPVRVREQVAQLARGSSPSAALTDAAAHRRAIEKVAPPSILVDETHRVVHLSDNAGRFLLPSGGPLSGDIVDLVRPELRFELRSALHRLFEQNAASLSLPIAVRFNGAAHRVLLLVQMAEKCRGVRHANRGRDVHRGREASRGPGVSTTAGLGRDGAPADAGAGVDAGAVARRARRVGSRQRGASRRQRGIAVDQRGVSVDLGGAGNQQGRTPVDQRRIANRQHRAQAQARDDLPRAQRLAEPDGGDRDRHAIPRLRPAHQTVHRARHRAVQHHAERRGASDYRLRAQARI